jgi:heterodisulfide reductase subunit C
MKDWGYKIVTPRQIDLESNDFSIAEYISRVEPSFKWCIGCGSCSGTCTAGQVMDFNPRKLNLLIQRGETVGLAEEAAKCMLCGKCQMVCPRSVNTRNVVYHIKRAFANVSTL